MMLQIRENKEQANSYIKKLTSYQQSKVGKLLGTGYHGSCYVYDKNKVLKLITIPDGIDSAFFPEFNKVAKWLLKYKPQYICEIYSWGSFNEFASNSVYWYICERMLVDDCESGPSLNNNKHYIHVDPFNCMTNMEGVSKLIDLDSFFKINELSKDRVNEIKRLK